MTDMTYEQVGVLTERLTQKIEDLQAERDRLRKVIVDAEACIQEEINFSNYDHEDVCRIGAMWDEAGSILADEVSKKNQ